MWFISMDKQGRYFNPSRATPLDMVVREGSKGRREALIGKQPAVAISTGYCTDSNLIRGKFNKSISILFHGQEWERYCCFVNMIFDEKEMIAQLYSSSLTFSTLPESISAPPKFPNAAISPLSGRRAKTNDTSLERARGALYFSDTGIYFISLYIYISHFFFCKKKKVPVYDARRVSQDFEVDFVNLDRVFPCFEGEVPIGSCVAVGHSVSSYIGKKDDEEKLGTKVHLATNVLFIIIFGMLLT